MLIKMEKRVRKTHSWDWNTLKPWRELTFWHPVDTLEDKNNRVACDELRGLQSYNVAV